METFFLGCFIFGALFTLASVALGFAGHAGGGHAGHAPGGHVAHADVQALHIGHAQAHALHTDVHVPHADAHGLHAEAQGPHADGQGQASVQRGGNGSSSSSLPLLNASSLLGGLTWFGAVGYVLLKLADWALAAVVVGALLGGALAWYLIARFIGLLLRGEREMDPADYRLEGTLGRVTVGIPAGGTGEVVYSKAGTRRSAAARALGGAPIAHGTEVVITAYVDGFATVQPWTEFLAAREARAAKQ